MVPESLARFSHFMLTFNEKHERCIRFYLTAEFDSFICEITAERLTDLSLITGSEGPDSSMCESLGAYSMLSKFVINTMYKRNELFKAAEKEDILHLNIKLIEDVEIRRKEGEGVLSQKVERTMGVASILALQRVSIDANEVMLQLLQLQRMIEESVRACSKLCSGLDNTISTLVRGKDGSV